jgi:hypothetical protein
MYPSLAFCSFCLPPRAARRQRRPQIPPMCNKLLRRLPLRWWLELNKPPQLPLLCHPQRSQVKLPYLPTGLPTFTPQSPSGGTNSQATCNQPLTSWQGPTANFSISNETRPEGTIILSMYVETELNQCGYLIITGDSFSGPVGQYSAGAFITGRQNLKAFGSFRITEGNWSIIVRNDSILAKGGCAPNC